ncbi:unnamed protein product [Pedinophyceae sp. YPF-701]|nr:unnamed protein product [Pedinophyceae sp. YPF-701]
MAPGDEKPRNLFPTLAKYLDRHLIFPILEFHELKGTYAAEEVAKGKIELLQKTNLIDFAADLYKQLHHTDEVPQELTKRRPEVIANLRRLEEKARPMIQFLSNAELVSRLRKDKTFNLQFLHEEFSIGPEQIDALYQFAKFQYECGNYQQAAELLDRYITLCTSTERLFSSLWGKLAASIMQAGLTGSWEAAQEDLGRLKEAIDNKTPNSMALNLVTQRVWLMHWSLFVLLNVSGGRSALVDLFLQEQYMNAIQTLAPHLLRYLAVAIVTNKSARRSAMRELVTVLKQEQYEYRDAITEFVLCLFVEHDFDKAQEMLRECEQVMSEDYFLVACKDAFLECARQYIFETYCRLHSCIDIKMLSERLNMNEDDAEKWIVNLVSSARLNAKIDSANGTVVMGPQHSSPFDQLMSRARSLAIRTYMVANVVVGGRV